MMDIRAILLMIVIVTPSFAATAVAGPCQNSGCSVDIHKAISIANERIARDIGRSSNLEVNSAKRYSTQWNELIPKCPVGGGLQQQIATKLKDRVYWLVYYSSRAAELGGDVAVFVDASSGEVIDVYRGR
jgi:hypothetical protein